MSFKDFLSIFSGKSADNILTEIVLANEVKIRKGSVVGWVLSPTIPLPVYFDLVEKQDINAAFICYYEQNITEVIDFIGEYSALLNPFLSDLLQETIRAYNDRYTVICIPALFAVIEGALSDIANPGNRVNTRYWAGTDREARKIDSGKEALPLLSLSHFLACTFMPSDFSQNPSPKINRHWSQHGRYESQPPKESVFQLLSAVAVILWVYDLRENV